MSYERSWLINIRKKGEKEKKKNKRERSKEQRNKNLERDNKNLRKRNRKEFFVYNYIYESLNLVLIIISHL